jgi:phosphoglycolate phosphatase
VAKPEMLKKIAKVYSLQKTIYIGDTLGDYQSALNANIDFGYARYGFGEVPTQNISFENFYEIIGFFFGR